MKTIILWLADISGVKRRIEIEAIKDIGHRMHWDHFWWNGGIMYNEAIPEVLLAFRLYSESLKDGTYPDISRVRDEVYKKLKERTLTPPQG